jgi:hypothetical protein
MAAEAKPRDFLENFATRDFGDGNQVDVASVPANADAEALLFRQNGGAPAPGDEEETDDTFIWDESDAVKQKYGQPMWRTDLELDGRVQRYWGKTRTEVAKALKQAYINVNKAVQDRDRRLAEAAKNPPANPNPNRVPDTKLPFDPIARKSPRQLSEQEVLQLQEMESVDPARAFRIKMEATTGYSPEGLALAVDRVNNAEVNRIANEAAYEFHANHSEDWLESKSNTAAISAYLKERNWPVTLNNLEIAFHDLAYVQKKLSMPVPEAPEAPPAAAAPAAPPLVEDFTPPPPPVSLPSASAPGRVQKSEADLVREAAVGIREMPLDEARASLADAFRKQRGAR